MCTKGKSLCAHAERRCGRCHERITGTSLHITCKLALPCLCIASP